MKKKIHEIEILFPFFLFNKMHRKILFYERLSDVQYFINHIDYFLQLKSQLARGTLKKNVYPERDVLKVFISF